MEVNANSHFTSDASEISLIRGGPFYRAQQALGLIRQNRWNLGRRIALAIAIGWLPLFLITALLNPVGLVSLIKDYRVHSRLLIAVPVLLLGELLMEFRFRTVMTHIRRAGLLEAADLAYLDQVIATLVRARDSFLPELAVLVLLIVHTATSYKGLIDATPWLARGAGADLHLTAAGRYAVLVSAPLFQFLLGLALWKWLLWTIFVFNLSRRNLKLVATHPDGSGGLGFLGSTAGVFAPIALAAAAVIGATWRYEILQTGVGLNRFYLSAIVLIATIALIALGPLAFFIPRLAALRRKGILEYGITGQMLSAEFDEKWIHHSEGTEAEFLPSHDSSTLADFGASYDRIRQLRPFPTDKGALLTLAIAVALPALPVILTKIPLVVILKDLLKALR